MDNSIVYSIIENHAQKGKKLFLLDAPTGFGKTYHVIKYIQGHYKEKKIFFIANQLKLLPNEDSMTNGLNSEEGKELKSDLLYLRSYIDSYLLNFENSYQHMDKEFKQINTKLLKTLDSLIKNIKKETDSQIKQIFYEKFSNTEYELREQIKLFLKLKGYKKGDIVKIKWLTDLYPAILLEKKQIILLSTKKFFLPIDTIYGGSISLYNKKYDNSMLFIDEFDTTKQVLLDTIIESTNENYKVDCFRLFRLLKNTFEKNILKTYTKSWENEEVTKIIDALNDLFINTNKPFYQLLDFPFKVKDNSLITKHFIFNDNITLSISKDTDLIQFCTYHDKKEKYNYIQKSKKSDSNDNNYIKLDKLCQWVIHCINEFCEKMIFIIKGYTDYINETKSEIDSEFENQDACTTVIDFLNIGEENKRFIVNRILESYTTVLKTQNRILDNLDNIKLINRKYHFYQNGFSYLEIKDDAEHNLESKCFLFSYNMTPEKFILATAMNYQVIGVSATSSYESSLVNYDLEYLKNVLNIDNLFAEEDELKLLKEAFKERNDKIYENVEIKTNFVGGQEEFDYLKEVWEKVFDINHKELLLEHLGVINTEKYLFKTISNIYKIFNDFVQDDTQSSFICFLTFNIRNKKKLFDLMKRVFNELLHEKKGIEYVIIDSVNFENNYKKIKEEKLEKGKKIFLMTTYQTVGAGINLQYNVTVDNQKYCPHLEIGVQRDYDGIYLSKPTNIIPSVESSYFDHHTLAHGLYALEYLKESKEIDPKRFKDNVGNLIRKALLNYRNGYFLQPYYHYESVCIGAAKIIIQAIGRLCRTEFKNSIVNIYIEKDSINYLYPILDTLRKKINNYEFNRILDSVSKDSIEVKALEFFEYKEKNKMSNEYIWNILKHYSNWDMENMEKWRQLRENVLKFPTCDNLLQHDFVNCYFEFKEPVNSYSYDKSWKYLTGVSMDMNKCQYKMSAASCGLKSALDNISGLKEYFIDLGYAIDFKKNRYILSVDLFHRIYKGAFGEVVGKYILLSNGIELNDINNPNHFERFDYYKNNVYFDFKNWSEEFLAPENEAVKKTIRKAKEIGAKKIFVINVFSDNYRNENNFSVGGIELTTVPWLYDIKEHKTNKDIIAQIKLAIEEQ